MHHLYNSWFILELVSVNEISLYDGESVEIGENKVISVSIYLGNSIVIMEFID